MCCVGEVHHGDAALVPGLHFDIAAGNRDQRAIVRDTVLRVALRGRQFVIAGEGQLIVLEMEDRIRTPLVRVVRAAARAQAAAPLVGKHDFGPIVGERSGVPVRVIGIVHGIYAYRMYRVLDVQQNPIARARARRQTNRRVHSDVVAVVCVRRLHFILVMAATVVQAVQHARARIDKNTRTGDHFRVLRRRHRNFDHVDTKQGRVGVLIRRFIRAPRQFFCLTDKRCA